MAFKEYLYVDFVWRGGEPLLVDRQFYRKVYLTQLKASRQYGTKFSNSIQTNGTLLNRQWINFFKTLRFGVGISFDGYNNNLHRGCSEQTIHGIKLCQKKNIPFGCISVITPENLDLIRLYTYLSKELKLDALKFTPCFKTASSNYTLNVFQYIEELKKLFDFWLYDTNKVELKPITDYVRGILDIYNPKECIHVGCLGRFLDIDSTGGIRICSHTMEEKFILGNIENYNSITEIFNGDNFNEILEMMIEQRQKCMKECELFRFCQGGCCSNVYRQQKEHDIDFSCMVYKNIIPYISSKIKKILENNENLSQYNPMFLEIIKEAICQNPGCFY